MLKNPNEYEKGKTIVYLIRHGDRIHIPENKDIGLRIPGPGLSKLGKRQAKEIAKKFSKLKGEVDAIYCSDMARAIETAEEISKIIHKKPVIYEEIAEFNQFLWKRKLYHPKFWKHYKKYKLAIQRFDKILEKNNGKVILVVAHGNVIQGLIGNKLKLSLKQIGFFSHENCHITKARFKGKKLDHINCINSKGLF